MEMKSPTYPNLPQPLRVREVAEIATVSPLTIRRAIDAGELPAFRFGRALRIDQSDVVRWLESKKTTKKIA